MIMITIGYSTVTPISGVFFLNKFNDILKEVGHLLNKSWKFSIFFNWVYLRIINKIIWRMC